MESDYASALLVLAGTLMGGFEADELRRLLVRVGDVRVKRPDGGEWWYLVGREPVRIARLEARRQAQDEVRAS